MIDLHTHTKYSDGTDDVVTLLKKAEEIGLEYLSITDHSTCKAYEELKTIDISKYYTGKLICGCEFFTTINGETIELLGYNLNTDILNAELPNMYKYELKDSNEFETKKLLEICKQIGLIMDYENVHVRYDIEFGSSVIMREITKNIENKKFFDNEKAWGNDYIFYRECMTNSKSKFFIDKSSLFPTPTEVIRLIKKAKGLVFIPHIFVYGENSEKFFNELIDNYNIDGIECYYSLFTDGQTQFLVNFCKENNLYVSGGSDYHGKAKPDINLGIGKGNLNIQSNIIKEWI